MARCRSQSAWQNLGTESRDASGASVPAPWSWRRGLEHANGVPMSWFVSVYHQDPLYISYGEEPTSWTSMATAWTPTWAT